MSQSTVKQPLQESLSALIDGEASELEVRRLLKADDESFKVLRENWSRYQLVSNSMKKSSHEEQAVDYRDLSLSISSAIADEPVHSVTEHNKSKASIWSGVGRFAVAASVAGAVVLGVQFAPTGLDNQIVDNEAVTLPSSGVPSSFSQGLPSNTAVSTVSNETGGQNRNDERTPIIINESTKEQLRQSEEQVNRLMLEHAQNASQNTQQGVLPYARVPESSGDQ
jgi:sigma-E factor negative regulatory protein RseA